MSICCTSNKRRLQHLISENVDSLLSLRLTQEEKIYHTNLFFDYADKIGVTRENFPKLLGFFGTEIAKNFSLRIFDIFSADKKVITLGEYLKYIDIYQHGERGERCLITFKLMDNNNNQVITEKEFIDYIKWMIAAIKVVYPSADDNILTDKEMKLLFRDIAKGKDYFNFEDFRFIYEKKPILLSWIDYFKKDEAEMLPNIDESIKDLLKLQLKFFNKFGNIVQETILLNGNKFKFNSAINQLDKFCKLFEKQKIKIEKYKSRINIRKIIDKLKAPKKTTIDYKIIKRNEINLTNFPKKQGSEKYEEDKKNDENELKKSEDINFRKNSSKVNLPKILETEESKDVTAKNYKNDINVNEQFNFLKRTITNISHKEEKNKFEYNIDFFERDFEKEKSVNSSFLDDVNNEDHLDDKAIEIMNKNIGKTKLVIDQISEEKIINDFNEDKPMISIKNKIHNKSSDNIDSKDPHRFHNHIRFKTINPSEFSKLDTSFLHSNELEKYNNHIKKFLYKLKNLCEISVQSNLIALKLYSLISRKYITPKQKESEKKNLDDVRISKANIPKKALSIIENKKLKNKILNPGDSNFKILLTMIMGVQKTVQSTPNIDIESKTDLTGFIKSMKYSLGEAFVNLEEQYYIKDYGGIIFNCIRKLYDIDIMSYIRSISPQDIITEIMISYTTNIEQLCSTGSSGSLFYYTRDAKYILKTIPQREFEVLKRILPNYYRYLKDNKWTLLPKFFGCYKLVKKFKKQKKRFYFIIMDNLFSTNKEINYRYDIKGSTIGRQVLNDTIKFNPKEKYDYAFKDLDLDQNKHFFNIGEKKSILINQLKKDTEFLKENNIIDYSLLIGVHLVDYEKKQSFVASENNGIYSKENIEDFKASVHNTNMNNKSLPKPINKTKNLMSKPIKFNKIKSEDHGISLSERNIEDDRGEDDLLFLEESFKTMREEDFVDTLLDKKHPFKDFADGGLINTDKKEIFYIGVIDILTEYSVIKKCEFLGKLLYHCSTKMSCVPAESYQERFINYMNKKIIE